MYAKMQNSIHVRAYDNVRQRKCRNKCQNTCQNICQNSWKQSGRRMKRWHLGIAWSKLVRGDSRGLCIWTVALFSSNFGTCRGDWGRSRPFFRGAAKHEAAYLWTSFCSWPMDTDGIWYQSFDLRSTELDHNPPILMCSACQLHQGTKDGGVFIKLEMRFK